MRRTMNWKGFVLILSVMAALFLVFFLMLRDNLHQKHSQENLLRVSYTRLEQEYNDLKNHKNQIGTEDYIISNAKIKYAYINKNDLRFEFTNPEALYGYTEKELKILLDELSD